MNTNFVNDPRLSGQRFLLFIISSVILATLVFIQSIAEIMPLLNHGHLEHGHLNYALYGDGGVLYSSAIANLSYWLHHGFHLQGIDWSTDNGASEFYLRANLSIYYPLLVLYSFIFKVFDLRHAMVANFAMGYLHTIIAAFFMQLLAWRFFNARFLSGFFFASFTLLAFVSPQLLNFLPFYLAFCLFPLLVYVALSSHRAKSKLALFLLSLVYFSYFFVGYLPLALAGTVMSLVFAAAYLFWIERPTHQSIASLITKTLAPVVIAGVVALPGSLAIVQFVKMASTPGQSELQFSAYSLSEQITNIISSFSTSIIATAPSHYLILGLLGCTFLIAFFFLPGNPLKALTEKQRKLFKFSATALAFILLISFGKAIVGSTLFFYFVPGLGKMHAYQRYFIFILPFFALLVTLALHAIIKEKPIGLLKALSGLFFFATLAISLGLTAHWIKPSPYIFWSELLPILLLITLASLALLLFERKGAWIALIACVFMIGLPKYYFYTNDYVLNKNISLTANKMDNDALLAFFKKNSDHDIIKYVNFLPGEFNYIPRNYPWVFQGHIHLSNYLGYEPQLAMPLAYRRFLAISMANDWSWLRRTGAQFVIYNAKTDPKTQNLIAQYTDDEPTTTFSNGTVIAKLNNQFPSYPKGYKGTVINNGYVQLQYTGTTPNLTHFKVSPKGYSFDLKIADGKARMNIPFWNNKHFRLQLNGKNTALAMEDHMDYALLDKGNYHVVFSYSNTLLTFFLYLMGIYYLLLIAGAIAFFWRKNPSGS